MKTTAHSSIFCGVSYPNHLITQEVHCNLKHSPFQHLLLPVLLILPQLDADQDIVEQFLIVLLVQELDLGGLVEDRGLDFYLVGLLLLLYRHQSRWVRETLTPAGILPEPTQRSGAAQQAGLAAQQAGAAAGPRRQLVGSGPEIVVLISRR